MSLFQSFDDIIGYRMLLFQSFDGIKGYRMSLFQSFDGSGVCQAKNAAEEKCLTFRVDVYFTFSAY